MFYAVHSRSSWSPVCDWRWWKQRFNGVNVPPVPDLSDGVLLYSSADDSGVGECILNLQGRWALMADLKDPFKTTSARQSPLSSAGFHFILLISCSLTLEVKVHFSALWTSGIRAELSFVISIVKQSPRSKQKKWFSLSLFWVLSELQLQQQQLGSWVGHEWV